MARYCANCGKQIGDNAAFCKYCGGKAGFSDATRNDWTKNASNKIKPREIHGTAANNRNVTVNRPGTPVRNFDDGQTSKKTTSIFAVVLGLVVVLAATIVIMYLGTGPDDPPPVDTGTGESAEAEEHVVTPLYADASSQHADMGDISYPPENVIDGDLATAWVEGADGEGRDEWIYVAFDNDDPIEALVIRNGYQKSDEAYRDNNRVRDALVEFDDGSVESFTLMDENYTEQVVVLSEEKRSSSIRLYIQSAYLSEDGIDTCITEIGILESGMDYPSGAEIVYADSY